MPVRTPALFQIEESLPSIRGRRSPNLKAAGYERAKIVICKIPSFGEHRGDLRSISGSDSPDFSNLLIDQALMFWGESPTISMSGGVRQRRRSPLLLAKSRATRSREFWSRS